MSKFGVWKETDESALIAIQDRRAAILECASNLFGTRGYDTLEVQLVADAAGMGKATLYRHFGNKEGLFLATLDREMEMLTQRMQEAGESFEIPFEALVAGVRSYFRFYTERPWVAELLIIERGRFRKSSRSTFDSYRKLVRPYWIARGQELVDSGAMKELSAEDAFELLSDALYGTLFTLSLGEEGTRFIDRGERIIRATLYCWVTSDTRGAGVSSAG